MRVAAYMYMYVGGGCTEPAELARKAAEQPAEWAAEGEGGQPRNTRLVNQFTSVLRSLVVETTARRPSHKQTQIVDRPKNMKQGKNIANEAKS